MIARRNAKPSRRGPVSIMTDDASIQRQSPTIAPTPGTQIAHRRASRNPSMTSARVTAPGTTVTPSSHMTGNPQSMVSSGQAGSGSGGSRGAGTASGRLLGAAPAAPSTGGAAALVTAPAAPAGAAATS